MALQWPSKISTIVPAKLRTGAVVVTAATLVGGGAAFAVLPAVQPDAITAQPSSNDAALGVSALTVVQADIAGRGGADRASRSGSRPAPAEQAKSVSAEESAALAKGGSLSKLAQVAQPKTKWTTTTLRVRAEASGNAKEVSVLSEGSKVKTTGITDEGWSEISLDGENRWVSSQYLTATEPKPVASSGGSGSSSSAASSGSGTSEESSSGSSDRSGSVSATGGGGACANQLPGLTSSARTVHNAICANFPQITSYGGVRADGYAVHPSGRAVDAMIPNWQSASGNGLGWSVANWLRGNAGRFNLQEIIFDQTIWTSQRSGDGWRSMSNRGSATANHRDHVHVATKN